MQVARSRKYTPSQDDVGFVLKYECSIFDPNHPYIDLGRPMLAFTSRVRPAPNLPLRNLVALPLPYNVTKAGPSSRFTVLSYNLLADLYAKVTSSACLSDDACHRQHVRVGHCRVVELELALMSSVRGTEHAAHMTVHRRGIAVLLVPTTTACVAAVWLLLLLQSDVYNHCPAWMMAWHYRKRNLLKELLTHRPDIMCLQEVQSDHFTEFLQPELTKAGYMGIYKKKTTEIFTGSAYTIDGCATFFKQERFHLVKKYEVEFNKAAISLADQMTNPQQKKATMNRLLKVWRENKAGGGLPVQFCYVA